MPPVMFDQTPFSGSRWIVENISANQRPERSSCFPDRPVLSHYIFFSFFLLLNFSYFRLLLRDHRRDFNETWHEASNQGPPLSLFILDQSPRGGSVAGPHRSPTCTIWIEIINASEYICYINGCIIQVFFFYLIIGNFYFTFDFKMFAACYLFFGLCHFNWILWNTWFHPLWLAIVY